MKTKFMKSLSAAAAALVMTMSLSVFDVNVGAVEFTYNSTDGTSYTATAADKIEFKKYLVMDADAQVPNTTFSFSVAQGTAVSADNTATPKRMEIKAGNVVKNESNEITSPSVTDVTFSSSMVDTSTGLFTSAQTGHKSVNLAKSGTETWGKYAVKTVTMTFTGIEYTQPGIYRYIVSEDEGTAPGVTYTKDKLVVDVYVTDYKDNDGKHKLHIANVSETSPYVISKIKNTGTNTWETPSNITRNDTDGSALYADYDASTNDIKADGLQNSYESHNLYFGKKVDGNQGSRDKYFKYDIEIANINNGDKFAVDVSTNGTGVAAPTQTPDTVYTRTKMAAADGTGNGTTILTASIPSGETNAKVTGTFYLQNDQYIIIKGLPVGATYSVTETEEDYLKTATSPATGTAGEEGYVAATSFSIGSGESAITFIDSTSGSVGSNDIKTGYINKKEGVVPTGILLNYTPYIIISIFAVAGIIFLAYRRKRNAE